MKDMDTAWLWSLITTLDKYISEKINPHNLQFSSHPLSHLETHTHEGEPEILLELPEEIIILSLKIASEQQNSKVIVPAKSTSF